MKITVTIPVRNQSEKLLNNLKAATIPYFDSTGVTYDILICYDGSDAANQKILVDGVKQLPAQVRLLSYMDMSGKGHNVQRCLASADGDYVMFMDADNATDLKSFESVKPLLGQYDCIIASRYAKGALIDQKQTVLRRFVSKCSRMIIKAHFHFSGITDTQCGYKFFRAEVAKSMVARQQVNGSSFDVEYLYFLKLNGFSVKEIPVRWTNDPDSTIRVVKDSLRFYRDLFAIKRRKKSYLLTAEQKAALAKKQ